MENIKYISDKLSVTPDKNIMIYNSNTWGLSDKNKMQKIIDQCGKTSKIVYIFFITDSCDSFSIPDNVIVYRTSLLKSLKHKNEFLLPYIWEGFEAFTPLEPTIKPIVGFCGLASQYRKKTIELFKNDDRITSKIIAKDVFWGGKPHDPNVINEFKDNMRESHFNICNRGEGNFSMRFYQTLSCGRIPILLNTDMILPFEDKINWNDIIIFANTEEELVELTVNCTNIVDKQIKCREIYDTYFAGTNFLDGIFSIAR